MCVKQLLWLFPKTNLEKICQKLRRSLEYHCQNTFIIYFLIKNKNVSIAELKLKCLKSENYILSDSEHLNLIHKNQLDSIWLKVIAKMTQKCCYLWEMLQHLFANATCFDILLPNAMAFRHFRPFRLQVHSKYAIHCCVSFVPVQFNLIKAYKTFIT